jgi:hypothetical protein
LETSTFDDRHFYENSFSMVFLLLAEEVVKKCNLKSVKSEDRSSGKSKKKASSSEKWNPVLILKYGY